MLRFSPTTRSGQIATKGTWRCTFGTWQQTELSLDFGFRRLQTRGLTLNYIFGELRALPQ